MVALDETFLIKLKFLKNIKNLLRNSFESENQRIIYVFLLGIIRSCHKSKSNMYKTTVITKMSLTHFLGKLCNLFQNSHFYWQNLYFLSDFYAICFIR